jgi:hypothetical protein
LVKVTLNTLLFPMVMVPKLRLLVLVVSRAVAAIPTPVSETVLGVLEASLATDTLPDKAPAVLGVKMTLKVACLPASIVRGSEMPVIVTPAAVDAAEVIVAPEVPLLVMVTDCEAVAPRLTEPNLIDDGATETVPLAAGLAVLDEALGAPVRPVQPEVVRIAKDKSNRVATEIAFVPAERAFSARFAEFLNESYVLEVLIEGHSGGRQLKGTTDRTYYLRTGKNLPLGTVHGKKRQTAPGSQARFANFG